VYPQEANDFVRIEFTRCVTVFRVSNFKFRELSGRYHPIIDEVFVSNSFVGTTSICVIFFLHLSRNCSLRGRVLESSVADIVQKGFPALTLQ
jgi:hypothetical protein